VSETLARMPSDSETEMHEFVLPQHTNAMGTAFGGTIMAWVDICAAIVAQRHCRRVAVTAAVDELQFLAPIKLGDLVRLHGRINAAFRTSVEVEVRAEVEDTRTSMRTLCVEALVTFVLIGTDGRPEPVPALVPRNEDDVRRIAEAQERRKARLARKKR
jgi:acyl-CoA hydrolase